MLMHDQLETEYMQIKLNMNKLIMFYIILNDACMATYLSEYYE